MEKENNSIHQPSENQDHDIPDIHVIDLEGSDELNTKTFDSYTDITPDCYEPDCDEPDCDEPDVSGNVPRKKRFRINIHMVLLAMVLIVFGTVFFRFKNWGQFISQEEIRNNIEGTYKNELDIIVPLTTEDGEIIPLNTEDGLSIVFFGNSPFADDRDSEDNLVNIIAEMTGAEVYNCSVGESYLAMESQSFSVVKQPLDAYTLYWMSLLATHAGNDWMFEEAEAVLGENIPPDAKLAIDTLYSIDFSTVDVIAILYDGYDYLAGHPMYSDQNATDITQFTGNLRASIETFQSAYPHIRIIVMSPPYAFSNELDENGEYISSDIVRYGWDVLSTYVILEGNICASTQVTFIDNLYGTITEDNAKEYLVDNLHLNVEGRKKIAERFVYALNYYNQD